MNIRGITTSQLKEIKEALLHMGLSENEISVYLALLTTRKTPLTALARIVRLPLTTVRSIAQRLGEEGIILIDLNKSRALYEAADPATIKHLLNRKIEDVSRIIPFLKKIKSEDPIQSHMRFFRGNAMRDIFHEAIGCTEKIIYEIVSARDFQNVLGERFHFTQRRLEREVRLKSLRVEMHEIKKYSRTMHVKELREARFLPRECTFRGSMMFWDVNVAYFAPKDENWAIVIESASHRQMVQQIFEILWSISRPMDMAL